MFAVAVLPLKTPCSEPYTKPEQSKVLEPILPLESLYEHFAALIFANCGTTVDEKGLSTS